MGVYADKFFGYMMDVTDAYVNSKEPMWEKYFDNEDFDPELKDLGFVCYYSHPRPQKGSITLFYDGMCGEYAKLVLIRTAEFYSDDESETNEEVNESLKMVPVPDDEKEKLEKAFKLIFGEEASIPPVYLMEFTHFH